MPAQGNSPDPRSDPQARATAAAVPLLGAFLASFAATSGFLSPVQDLHPEALFPVSIFQLIFITFPLVVYGVLYARLSFWANPSRSITFVRIASVWIVIFVVTVYVFPIFISYMIRIFFSMNLFEGMGILALIIGIPTLAGMSYGLFLSVIIDSLGKRRWPRRMLNHVISGGIVGFLTYFAYAILGVPKDQGNWSVSSAFVLTLCYLPHYLSTSPWRRERGGEPS